VLLLGCCTILGTLPLRAQSPAAADPQQAEDEAAMAEYADAANFQTGGAVELAIEAWTKFLEHYPKHAMSADASHFLGVCYMQREKPDYSAASTAFARALQSQTYSLREESLANQGWCLYASAGEGQQRDASKLTAAIETFETLCKENPNSRFLDRATFYSGEAAYALGQPERAIEFYDQLLAMPQAKDSPLRCDALYARGVAQEECDQMDNALATYTQLLASCDSRELVTDVRLRMGDLMINRKNYDEAVRRLSEALQSAESDEDRAYAMFRQAFAMVQANRPAEAAELYEKLIAEFPSSPQAAEAVLASAQSTYRSGDIAAAAERFSKVLAQNNLQAATEAAHWLARIEITQQRPAEAARIARQQLERGVEGEFAIALRLDLAEALSLDPSTAEESLRLFESAYREAPADPLAPRALYNAAFSALQVNQPAQALSLAREFITKFPNDTLVPDVKFVAAEGQLLTGKAEAAADTYRQLLASASRDNVQRPVWLLRAATTFNTAGRFDETIQLLSAEINGLPQPGQKAEAQLLIGQAQLRAGQPQQAVASFTASRQADPNWPRAGEALLLTGQAQMAAGDSAAASASWQQLIGSSPNTRMADQARYKLAQVESDQQDFSTAIGYYDQILQSKQDPALIPYAQYGKGWALMQAKEYQPALESLDQMLEGTKQHPLRNDATLARGIVLRNLGQMERARTDLESYLAIPPRGTELGHALYELALIDQQAKQPGQAAEKLERLVAEVPDYPSMDKVLYELGWSLQENGNDEAAVKYFTSLIEKFPDAALVGEAAFFLGQKFYAAMQWDLAAQQFETVASKASDPGLAEKASYRLGWSRFKSDNYPAAAEAFLQQVQRHPDGKLILDAEMMIGECRFKQSDFKPALAAYQVARERIRKNNDTAQTIRDPAERQIRELVFLHGGQSAAQQKSWDEAIQWYDELRERFPTSEYLPQIFYETGFAHQQKGDSANALKFFQEVADKFRNESAARARFMMGEIYFANKEFDKAIPEFQRVMYGFGAEKAPARIQNWQAKSGFEAARCSELLMQIAKTPTGKQQALKYATDFFTYVVEKHPNHELAAQSRQRLEALKP
jgi:TolA-binding protein